jgi:hypothetical protein
MTLPGTKVRFLEWYRPRQVRQASVGVIIQAEERPGFNGRVPWVRARFGDYISPWIEATQLERVSLF